MTDLRQAAQQALKCIERCNKHGWILADFEDEVYAAITALKTALEKSEPPPEWKAAQRPWQGLTDEDMKDLKTHVLDFIYGARWAETKLKERNHG